MSNIKSNNSSSSSNNLNEGYQPPRADPEVAPQAKRRQFSAAYKERILAEADACTEPGQIWGAAKTGRALFIISDQLASREKKGSALRAAKTGPQRSESSRAGNSAAAGRK